MRNVPKRGSGSLGAVTEDTHNQQQRQQQQPLFSVDSAAAPLAATGSGPPPAAPQQQQRQRAPPGRCSFRALDASSVPGMPEQPFGARPPRKVVAQRRGPPPDSVPAETAPRVLDGFLLVRTHHATGVPVPSPLANAP